MFECIRPVKEVVFGALEDNSLFKGEGATGNGVNVRKSFVSAVDNSFEGETFLTSASTAIPSEGIGFISQNKSANSATLSTLTQELKDKVAALKAARLASKTTPTT